MNLSIEYDSEKAGAVKRAAVGYWRGTPFKLLPLYVGVIIALSLSGVVTLELVAERGATEQEVARIAELLRLTIWFYAAFPLVYSLHGAVRELRGGYS